MEVCICDASAGGRVETGVSLQLTGWPDSPKSGAPGPARDFIKNKVGGNLERYPTLTSGLTHTLCTHVHVCTHAHTHTPLEVQVYIPQIHRVQISI